MDETLEQLGATIAGALGAEAVKGIGSRRRADPRAHGARHRRRHALPARRPALPVLELIDIAAVDWPGRERRFDVVYHLLSPKP